MHDIRWIRDNPDAFDAGLKARGLDPEAAALIAIDEQRRMVLTRLQDAQNRRNQASKEIGRAKGSGDEAGAQALIDEIATLKDTIQADEEVARRIEADLQAALSGLPNIPEDGVPVGADEAANVLRSAVGEPRKLNFEAKQHFEIGEALGQMDFETAAKLSGARFVILNQGLARMERALAQFMLDLHTGENGYTEVSPPLLVRDEVMFGTGQLPKFFEDQFAAYQASDLEATGTPGSGPVGRVVTQAVGDPDRYWLVPTAEVPLTNLVRESILDEAELPLRFTAFTPCFRAEAGAAGRDTRGMIRQHQFSKVELVSITTPQTSGAEHERMLTCAEEVLKRLELAYQVLVLSTGDMGFSARKTYDIEVWLPGQKAYREISSCSVCDDFQARRMNARYRPDGEKGTRFVHTLNGSGLAVGRALIAVLETYQQADGSVVVPEALKPYMGGVETIESVQGATS